MKNYGKRILSMLCAVVMVLSMAAMIVPMHAHAEHSEYVGDISVAEFDALLSKTHASHYHLYSAADAANSFSHTGAGVVDDTAAVGGKAVLHNYNKVDNVDVSTGTNLYSGYAFDMNHTASGLHLGKISANVINNDGDYHVYRTTINIPSDMSAGGGVVYLFGTWQVQPKNMGDHLYNWKGQTVDLYISLKVVGEKTAAFCYIDRVVLMEGCETHADATGEFCAQCGKQLRTNAVPQNGIIADLNTTNFYLPYGDPVADDASAHTGKAAFFSYDRRAATGNAGLMNAVIRTGAKTLDLRMQIEGVSDEVVGSMSIARLNANARGGEYVLYKFADMKLVPAKGETAHKFYMFECWGFQVDLAGYVDQLVGKDVDVYLSLKVTGDVSDSVTNTPAYYIDRIIIADPTAEEPEATEPETPAYKEESVLYKYTAAGNVKFNRAYGDPVVTDNASGEGSVAMYSYAWRMENARNADGSVDTGRVNAMIRAEHLRFYRSNSDYVGEILAADMQLASRTGQYVTYKFANVPVKNENGEYPSMFYMFDCWGFQIPISAYSDTLSDKTVNIYLTMKITGNVASRGADAPAYYIEKVVLTDAATDYAEHTHSYSDMVYIDENTHGRICLTCGATERSEHGTWDDGVVTKEPTLTESGTKVYTCSGGCTRIEEIASEGLYLCFGAQDFALPYSDPVVNDADAFGGKAALMSWAGRKAAHGDESDLPEKLVYFDDMVLGMYLPDDAATPVGEISVPTLQAASQNGGYITYKFENATINGVEMIYMFQCWGFQIPLSNYKEQLKDKTVNVYVSMKITGDPSNANGDAPDYYIDKVEIIEAAYDTATHEHTYSDLLDINDNFHGKICTTCGHLDATGHDYGNGEVVVAPSYEAEGEIKYTCATCNGTKTEIIAKLASPTSGWNLTLKDDVAMNLHLNVTAEQIDTASVDLTINGVTKNIALNTLPKDENGLPVLTVELAAAQMMDEVAVVLHVAEQEDIIRSYTVREYADYIMNNSDDEKLVDLVKHMLNYGAAAQEAFDHNADKPANADVEITAAEVPADGGEIDTEGGVNGIVFYGASLVHRNKIAVRFYFSGSLEGIENADKFTQKGDMYYLEVADIVPQNLDQDITVTVSDGTNNLVVTYAPMDYIIRMYNKADSSAETKALVQALYGYYAAAEVYTAE